MQNVFANTSKTRESRYTGMSTVAPSDEGGQVGIGFSKSGASFLVHRLPRSEEAIALGAVGSAIGTVIPTESVVAALAAAGKTDELVKHVEALVKATTPAPAPESAKPKAK